MPAPLACESSRQCLGEWPRSSGSRSEMLTRLLEALRSGADVRMDARPVEQQTLAVASRWDADADGSEGGNATHASAVGEAGGSSASADLDGDEIDGEDIDGEAMEGSPKAFPKGSTVPPSRATLVRRFSARWKQTCSG